MKEKIKSLVVSNKSLTLFLLRIRRFRLSMRKDLIVEKGVRIGFSSILGGHNCFKQNSVFLSSEIGFASYISEDGFFMRTKIGKFCSIGQDVRCIMGKHPANTFVSTHPAFFSMRKQVGFTFAKEQLFNEFAAPITKGFDHTIEIGNDVWIGAHTKIIDGVKIGDGAIIAACSLVNKDVPPYTIYGGIPAKLIKPRFNEKQVRSLLALKWWDKDLEWIKTNAHSFINIDDFIKKFRPNE